MVQKDERRRGRPRSFDPDVVLEKARAVFWNQGYAATSLDDLAAALADKAHRQGAIAWRINAASSGNRLYGSAIIYQ